jgi:hypothetical protein
MTVHTPRSRRAVTQRLDRRNARAKIGAAEVKHIVTELASGKVLRQYFDRRKRCWEVTGYGGISDELARQVIKHRDVVGVGDCLFPDIEGSSQTYRYARG